MCNFHRDPDSCLRKKLLEACFALYFLNKNDAFQIGVQKQICAVQQQNRGSHKIQVIVLSSFPEQSLSIF